MWVSYQTQDLQELLPVCGFVSSLSCYMGTHQVAQTKSFRIIFYSFFPSSPHPGLFAKIGKLSLGFERRKQKLVLNMVNLRFLRDMQRAAGHEGLVSRRQIGVVSEIWEPPAHAHHRETWGGSECVYWRQGGHPAARWLRLRDWEERGLTSGL